jgi:hypothetical protein
MTCGSEASRSAEGALVTMKQPKPSSALIDGPVLYRDDIYE